MTKILYLHGIEPKSYRKQLIKKFTSDYVSLRGVKQYLFELDRISDFGFVSGKFVYKCVAQHITLSVFLRNLPLMRTHLLNTCVIQLIWKFSADFSNHDLKQLYNLKYRRVIVEHIHRFRYAISQCRKWFTQGSVEKIQQTCVIDLVKYMLERTNILDCIWLYGFELKFQRLISSHSFKTYKSIYNSNRYEEYAKEHTHKIIDEFLRNGPSIQILYHSLYNYALILKFTIEYLKSFPDEKLCLFVKYIYEFFDGNATIWARMFSCDKDLWSRMVCYFQNEDYICCICYEIPIKPLLMLNCFHIICTDCSNILYDKFQKLLQCPMCRKTYKNIKLIHMRHIAFLLQFTAM